METDDNDNKIKQGQDLGLGDRVVQENRTRLLNHDGSFNVYRKGVFEHGAFSPYHAILNMSWRRFFGLILAAYLLVNIIFTGLFLLCGLGAFPSIQGLDFFGRASALFFFSIHIITTIADGGLQPATLPANILLALEAMTGLLGFAMAAGITFARFSNPAVKFVFSDRAVIAPYKDITGFMFRMINGRSNELIDVRANVSVGLADNTGKRYFHQLALERDNILVFPLSWTVVHPITKDSPLYGLSSEEFVRREPEFLVSISAVDQDLSKTVYARQSYVADEVICGARFVNILEQNKEGTIFIDPARIHEIEDVPRTQALADQSEGA
jgi:inward rectifier potassium channel